MADLLVIVPSRGRPDSVARTIEAWTATDAWGNADLLFAIDADDPARNRYIEAVPAGISIRVSPQWQPMVHKLNAASISLAHRSEGYFALAFAGDDHLPRTPGWAIRYLAELREMGTGIVYGDDLIQHERLPTQWAITADIVRTLGRMVPAPVDHMYCDNSMLDLGRAADCIRYLPDVVIEHCHPLAGRAEWDDGYRRVNAPAQYDKDRRAYRRWQVLNLAADVSKVRALRSVEV